MTSTTEPSAKVEPLKKSGTTFGRYHVRRKIGEGAMARVFEAYDPATDRRIALKVLKPSLRSDEALVTRFMNEARAAGGLSHPHIVQCYDVDSADDTPYITMELLKGPSLEELLAEKNSTDPALAVEYLCQIALALDHAHQAGRIHRDIKPSNILLTQDLKIAKIADFGVARIEQTDLTAATSLGEFIGTPRYTSPEQLDGAMVDGRSDLFSFGAVAYEMLTGQKAFAAKTMSTLIAQITNETPSQIRDIQPDIAPALAAAVEKLLAKSPDDRWQTGADFVDAFRQPMMKGTEEAATFRLPWLLGGLVTIVGTAVVLISLSSDPTDEETVKVDADLPAASFDQAQSVSPPVSGLIPIDEVEPSAPPRRVPPPPIWPENWQESWLQYAIDKPSGDCYWLEYDGGGQNSGLRAVTDNPSLHQRTRADLSIIQGSFDMIVDKASSDSTICRLANALNGEALPAQRRMIDIVPPNRRLHERDTFELSIIPPAKTGHVILFHIDSRGMVSQLYAADDQSWPLSMEKGRIKIMSGSEDGLWEVYPPFGTEVLFVLATNGAAPFSLGSPQPLSIFLERLATALAEEDGIWHLASLLQFETLPR